jgi:hypothetical protein
MMTTCRLCQHSNPPGAQRCEECGTWLSQDADPAASTGTSSAGRQTTAATGPPVSEFDSEVLALLTSGKKIDAIKFYRETKGTGLKEAKEAVEALGERHGVPRGSGCAGVVLVLLFMVAAVVIIF